jgi:hypothetical protein
MMSPSFGSPLYDLIIDCARAPLTVIIQITGNWIGEFAFYRTRKSPPDARFLHAIRKIATGALRTIGARWSLHGRDDGPIYLSKGPHIAPVITSIVRHLAKSPNELWVPNPKEG